MKTLWLLRHAKARPPEPGRDDHARPLEARGRDDAARIGRHLAARGARPDLVLCSSAVRTRETFECVAAAFHEDWVVLDERDLYLASAGELLRRVQAVPDAVASVLLVGHNPGVAELALRLTVSGAPDALADLRRKVPTGALAELRLDAPHWRRLPRGCELASYVRPKQLRDGQSG